MQRGFTQVYILLGLVALIIVGGIAYYLGTQKNSNSPSQNLSPYSSTNIPSPTSNSSENRGSQGFTSTRCDFMLSFPKDWLVKETTLVPGTDNPDYQYGCVEIQAPDYKTGLDNKEGFYVSINRSSKGASFNDITINSLEDYIKAHESMIQPAMTVKGKQNMTYGDKQGIQFEKFGRAEATAFIFIKNNYIYEISWPTNYQGNNINELPTIITSI